MMHRHKRRPVKRRYRLNPKLLPTLLLALVAVSMVLIICVMLKPNGNMSVFSQPKPTQVPTSLPTATPAVTSVPTTRPTATPKIYNEVHVRAAGDIMAHDDQLMSAKQDDGSYDFTSFFSTIAETLSDADLTMANLETTIGEPGTHGYSGYPYFHTPKSLLTVLKGAGIDLLTTSNNHCLDRFFDGLVETLDSIDEAGIAHTGTFRSRQEYQKPYVTEINGIKIGIAAYTYGTNGMEKKSDEEGVKWGIMYLENADFKKSADRLRAAGAELLIAVPHWGKEYKRAPEAETVSYARKMAEAGFDVIIGSHPHMVQPIEWIETERSDGSTGRTLVAYSLGNFISAQRDQYRDTGIVLDFTIRESIDTGAISIADVGYVPVWVWRYADGEKNAYRMLPCGAAMESLPAGISEGDSKRLGEAWNETVELMTTEGITALKK